MFGKKWKNSVLIEGEKEANLFCREEGLQAIVNSEYDEYPVDVTISKRRRLMEAIKKSIRYSKMGIYNMLYRVK